MSQSGAIIKLTLFNADCPVYVEEYISSIVSWRHCMECLLQCRSSWELRHRFIVLTTITNRSFSCTGTCVITVIIQHIVSCNNILPYEMPMSRVLGHRTLVPITGISSYVYCPLYLLPIYAAMMSWRCLSSFGYCCEQSLLPGTVIGKATSSFIVFLLLSLFIVWTQVTQLKVHNGRRCLTSLCQHQNYQEILLKTIIQSLHEQIYYRFLVEINCICLS